ncbi:asparagine synthase (glutamine-hydrolyzing), partial [candidate division KSB1 bacterium]|nr:asparagine synthase (glutamine-hydrolyzing) [candidate division KSB1 bacterium]
PDNSGHQWFDRWQSGLGHRRLSIIDLSPAGHQPMSNVRGNLWITYNGEIYNYQEIRAQLEAAGCRFRSNSDTEVVLKAYEQWGETCLHKLNGMFAFAIFDQESGELFAARDRVGIKPFYYHAKGVALVFASEIKAILATGLTPKSPDDFALHTPTRYQISPYTGFQDIFKLPPGHCLTFSGGELKIKQYWDVETAERLHDESSACDELDWLLQDSVRLQMIADVPVGVFLSGGLDSSIISALVRKNTEQDVHAFTIKFADTDQKFEKMVDDSFYARQVAGQLGFLYHELEIEPKIDELLPKMIWHLDEPLADPAAINTYLISRAARELGIIVLLNGMGGDEIFGGYRKQLACLKADTYQKVVPGFLRAPLEKAFEKVPVATGRQGLKMLRWSKRFLSFASLPQVERFLVADLAFSAQEYRSFFRNGVGYYDTHYFQSQNARLNLANVPYLTRMCLNDTKVFLPEHNLTYSDKATMAAGIESRPPLTDHRLVEFMFSLPPEFRIRKNVQKYLLKKVSEKYVDREIIYRPKAPFGSPLRSWIRGPLAPMVDDLLNEDSLKKRGLYNSAFVSKLIKNDRSGLEDNAHVIWTLLTNEVWFQTFFQ